MQNSKVMIFSFLKWTSIFMGLHFFMYKILTLSGLTLNLVFNFYSVNLFFIITSFITISALYLLSKKNNQYLGFIYLGLSTVKTILCYAIFQDVLSTEGNFHFAEKVNILTLFFVFMIIELYQSSEILNNVAYKSED